MSSFDGTIESVCAITLIALVAAASFVSAQSKPEPKESVPAFAKTIKPDEPLHATWVLKNLNGRVNLLVNPDGSWNYNGAFQDKKPGQTFDVTFVIKNSVGSIYIFNYKGDATNGVQFGKQGKSQILHDDYQNFEHTNWSAEWVLHTFNKQAQVKYEAVQKRRKEVAPTRDAEASLAADEVKEEEALAAAQKTEDTVADVLKLVSSDKVGADKANLAGIF